MNAPTVAVLYVDPRGPYPAMAGVDCWDEKRDAKGYAGPYPVVAHPPCGPWSFRPFLRLRCKQDPSCGPAAVRSVRHWGGVLEHPAGSLLWAKCGMPRPGCLPDAWGGWSLAIEQGRFGHRVIKPTWLYIVGASADDLPPAPAGRRPKGRYFDLSPKQRRLTPPAMAQWLVTLARSAGGVER